MSRFPGTTTWARASAIALAVPALLTFVPGSAQAATTVETPAAVRGIGWGNSEVPTDTSFTQISQSYRVGLGLTSEGKIQAWGSDYQGARNIPSDLDSKVVIKVSEGFNHGLAQTSDGKLTTWGQYDDGANAVQAAIPAEVADSDIVDFVAGYRTDLAITSQGKVLAWGENGHNGLNVPASLDSKTVTQVATAEAGSVALTSDGKVTTWGDVPATPASLDDENFVAIATGGFTVLALNDEGKLFGWGGDHYGQATIPSSLDNKVVTSFASGGNWSMAATADGTLQVWGNTSEGGQSAVPPALTGKHIVDLQATRYGALATYGALASESEPWINGAPSFGDSVSVEPGGYSATPDSYDYQWNADGNPIDGATGTTYAPTADTVGKTLTVTETVVKEGWASATQTSEPTDAVEPAYFGVSASTKFSTNQPRVGKTVTVRVTGSEPKADSYTYQWTRNGKAISGARGTAYKPTSADLGRTLGIRVTAIKAGYEPIDSTPIVGRVEVGAAKLKVSVSSKVKRGKKLSVKVSGLAPRERYTIRMFGFDFATGKADSKGRINRKLKISSSAVPSKQTVKVIGSFNDRVGSDKTKITKK